MKFTVTKGYKGEYVIRAWTGILDRSMPEEVLEWCHETFGDPGRNKKYHAWRTTYASRSRIFLRKTENVVLFQLRWGGIYE